MLRCPLGRLGLALSVWCLVLSLGACARKVVSPPAAPAAAPAPSAASRLEAGKKAFAADGCAKALPALTEAVRLDPSLAEVHLYLGLCEARKGEVGRGRAELTEAARLDPTDPRPLEALGILYYGSGDHTAAASTLDAAIGRGSKNAQVFYYQGNLAMLAGDCRHALHHYRQAMVLEPSFAAAAVEYQSARMACARAEMPVAAPAPKPVTKPASRPAAKPADKPAAKPASRPAGQSATAAPVVPKAAPAATAAPASPGAVAPSQTSPTPVTP